MNAGIILSYFNQRYVHDALSTVCEFIPQVRPAAADAASAAAVFPCASSHTQSTRRLCVVSVLCPTAFSF